jgi:cholesterol transport system auxiliary component
MMQFRRCFAQVCHCMLAVTLACALGGCTLSRPSPVKDTYLLQASLPKQPLGAPRPAALKVGAIAVAAPFRGKALVYREGDLKYETDFYNEFLASPSAMLTESASAWLAAARVFRDVLPASANADGDYVLEAFVSELYGDFRETAKPAAVITAKFFLIDNRTLSGVPMWQTELTQRVSINVRNADALAAGFDLAWTAILADLSRQLEKVPLASAK